MDKKNTFIGVLLVAAAFACYFVSARYAPTNTSPAAVRRAVAQQTAAAPASEQVPAASEVQAAFASAEAEHAGAKITVLENDFIQVHFTNFGGSIRDVALRKYPATIDRPDPFVFNELHKDPILAFVDQPGLDRRTTFQLVSQTADSVVFRTVLNGRIEVTRRYTLAPSEVGATDPYQLHEETTFRNLTDKAVAPWSVQLALGTAAPINALDIGQQLSTGYSDGHNQNFFIRSKLESSGGFFGVGAHGSQPFIANPGPIVWGAVTNQFFASILTPVQPAAEFTTRRVKLLPALPDTDRNAYGITGDARFDIDGLAPHGQATLAADLYVGPKEYRRLSNLDVFKADQDKVMQFGMFKFFSALLLTLMTWIHTYVSNWGLAIVFTTLLLKLVFMPLTLVSARSARRMQKLQPELKALKEKFKDSPQKQQAATMALFKEHKVNPMGGCLPMLITLPFFFGFYRMLMSAAELRFAPFLWARDLSAPDTVGHIPGLGIAINILPILFATTSFIQMQLTPQPTMDNSQARMMKFMPVIMLIFYYRFSCALSLYSTVNGLFSIGQQLVINRGNDPVPAPAAAKSPGGRPVKNVTPGKKK